MMDSSTKCFIGQQFPLVESFFSLLEIFFNASYILSLCLFLALCCKIRVDINNTLSCTFFRLYYRMFFSLTTRYNDLVSTCFVLQVKSRGLCVPGKEA